MLLVQNIEGLFPVRQTNPECFLFSNQRLDGFDADGRVHLSFYRVEQEFRLLVGVEERHPNFEVNVTDCQCRIVKQRWVVNGDARSAIREIAIPKRVKDALGVETQHRPPGKSSCPGIFFAPIFGEFDLQTESDWTI